MVPVRVTAVEFEPPVAIRMPLKVPAPPATEYPQPSSAAADRQVRTHRGPARRLSSNRRERRRSRPWPNLAVAATAAAEAAVAAEAVESPVCGLAPRAVRQAESDRAALPVAGCPVGVVAGLAPAARRFAVGPPD